MAKLTGISATTPNRLLFGAGTLSVGGTSVGATTGETAFTVEKDLYFPELNGAAGKVKGTGWCVSERAILKVTVSEFTMFNLGAALPGLQWSSNATPEATVASSVGCIDSTEYVAVVWTGQDCDGDNVTLTFSQAIMIENLDVSFSDSEEAKFDLTFEATYTTADPDARPWTLVIEI